MNYSIEYFNSRVLAEIELWPDGILADYARLVELLMEFGPNLKMPHSKAMGKGLFELLSRWTTHHYSARLYQENTGYIRA
jgi:Phage derived protein Gp49-like (DUF891)